MSRAWEPLVRRTRALLLLYLVAVVIPLPWAAAPVRSDGGETGQPLGFDVGCHVEIGAFVGSSPPAATQVQALEHLILRFSARNRS